jgi:hypothetical protein
VVGIPGVVDAAANKPFVKQILGAEGVVAAGAVGTVIGVVDVKKKDFYVIQLVAEVVLDMQIAETEDYSVVGEFC